MALMCYEAQEEHDPEHADGIAEVLGNLQKQLNVSSWVFFSLKHFKQDLTISSRLIIIYIYKLVRLCFVLLFCCVEHDCQENGKMLIYFLN